ncbi:hypothetical protein JYK02_13405 [Corallococcus macrosporus]|uniref:AAA+ ATPase domain-containing protein n=1 Tax=Corallococcus macrosporus TaxID=35 RepID=A0ABS3DA36_9BACT|nr:AAA family ATPase [Corallococcus macrosporus]MBN8228502.1 hypothetical protein [Corallococcus macrosporus]
MAVTVLVVSGPMGAGKTTLAQGLARRFGALHLPSEGLLRKHGGDGSRRSRQELVVTLDRETGGRWLAKEVLAALHGQGLDASHPVGRVPRLIIVDAASSEAQLDSLRASPGLRVVHVHLDAPEPEQALRFARQRSRVRHKATALATVEEAAPHAEQPPRAPHAGPALALVEAAGPRADQPPRHRHEGMATAPVEAARAPHAEQPPRHRHEGMATAPVEAARAPRAEQPPRDRHEGTAAAAIEAALAHRVEQPSCAAPRIAEQDRFEAAWAHPAERAVHALASLAELVVDTARTPPDAVLVRVASRLGLYGRPGERLVDLIVPGPHGDVDTRPLTAQLVPHYDVLLRLGMAPVPSREELEDAFAQGHRVLIESAGPAASVCLAAAGIAPGRVRRTVMVCLSEGSAFDWVRLREAASLNGPTDLALVLMGDLAATNWAARRFDQLTDAARHHLEELERVAGAPVSFLAPSPQARHLIERRPW